MATPSARTGIAYLAHPSRVLDRALLRPCALRIHPFEEWLPVRHGKPILTPHRPIRVYGFSCAHRSSGSFDTTTAPADVRVRNWRSREHDQQGRDLVPTSRLGPCLRRFQSATLPDTGNRQNRFPFAD